MAGNREQEKGAASRALDLDAEALVAFFVKQSVGLGGVQCVAIETVGSLGGFVFDGIEKRAVVGCPGGAGDKLDAFGKCLPGAKVLDLQGVLTEAASIERVGQEVIAITD